ncbi:McrBC 5-methylcytosine restriction system component [Natranaerovirga pectinivora]|uniref:McrBC 5-methylcytosine restriction system component n=1 Tax=Natranaerovirga pectinivora TaxID=682400 RepID=A0A4R3MJV2_9FIRM|nr:hypothetical protein [Natranaerovirga pectinivora]TCT14535.1 McrBC 5-methylcytosine restriction system component [Natranaerovirga pectinivora]
MLSIKLKENTRYVIHRDENEDTFNISEDKHIGYSQKISKENINFIRNLSLYNIESLKKDYNLVWIDNDKAIEVDKNKKSEKLVEFESDSIFWVRNFIGVMKLRDENQNTLLIEIGTRFDKENKYNFLQAMLESYFSGGIQKSPSVPKEDNNILDILLMHIYATYLKSAYRKGLLKTYQTKRYNEYNLKGNIDFSRHMKVNTPFMGKVAYNKREYSYDNPIMWLVLKAHNYINAQNSQIWKSIYERDVTIKDAIRVINENTPSYSSTMNLINNPEVNKKVNHPYYKEYEELRKISLDIIKRNGLSVYGNETDQVSGILVYVPDLWEKFLYNEVFSKTKINTKEQKKIYVLKKENGMQILPNYIDFFVECNDKKYIFDAKYSTRWNKGNYDSEAIRQIINYVHLKDASAAGIICPNNDNESIEESKWKLNSDIRKTPLKVLKLDVPESTDDKLYNNFKKELIDSCNALEQKIKEFLSS